MTATASSPAAAIATDHRGVKVAPGIAEAWDRFSRIFSSALWDNPERRRALRWRSKDTAQEVAERLAWYVAADVQEGRIIPTDDLAVTIRLAILDEFATGQKLHHARKRRPEGHARLVPTRAGLPGG